MNKIKDYLDAASAAYYAGKPFISDESFDRLAESAGYFEVGAKQHENVCKHLYPMYSLQKFYEDESAQPLADEKDKVCTPKLDGACISLMYLDGRLVRALTRGDGTEGQDITHLMYARKDLVPLSVDRIDPFQVGGEVVSPKETVNSRNYAAGALNLKDVEEFKTRAISFYAYSVMPFANDTFTKDMQELEAYGFQSILSNDLHLIYPCDGLVFRVNSNARFEELGYTAKFPRGAYAKKERGEAVETTILAVEWGVGRTGKVTPVAILEPIMIGDKKVSRATLNNPGFIEALGICVGDIVGITLAGMIIPQVLYKVDV